MAPTTSKARPAMLLFATAALVLVSLLILVALFARGSVSSVHGDVPAPRLPAARVEISTPVAAVPPPRQSTASPDVSASEMKPRLVRASAPLAVRRSRVRRARAATRPAFAATSPVIAASPPVAQAEAAPLFRAAGAVRLSDEELSQIDQSNSTTAKDGAGRTER